MDKKQLVSFLKQRKRGVYALLTEVYADVLSTPMSTPMALEVIRQDLQNASTDPIELNYFSLLKAIKKAKKAGAIVPTDKAKVKWDFKDAHELPNTQKLPGSFTLSNKR